MITTGFMYWLTRLDDIREIMMIIGGFGAILTPFFLVVFLGPFFDDMTNGEILRRRLLTVFVPLFAVATVLVAVGRAFVPSTKDMAAIVVVPRIANSETTKELGEGVVELAKQWIEELKPSKGKSKNGK